MSARDLVYIGAAVVLAVGIRECFPKREPGRTIPTIVTKFDTVRTPPETLVIRHFTTDTFNLVVRQTIHDTVVINVGRDSTPSDSIWPLLQYAQRSRDTAEVRTFDLQTGRGASSLIYTPGPLTAIEVVSTPTPKLAFGSWPGVRFRDKVKYGAYGAAVTLTLLEMLRLSK